MINLFILTSVYIYPDEPDPIVHNYLFTTKKAAENALTSLVNNEKTNGYVEEEQDGTTYIHLTQNTLTPNNHLYIHMTKKTLPHSMFQIN